MKYYTAETSITSVSEITSISRTLTGIVVNGTAINLPSYSSSITADQLQYCSLYKIENNTAYSTDGIIIRIYDTTLEIVDLFDTTGSSISSIYTELLTNISNDITISTSAIQNLINILSSLQFKNHIYFELDGNNYFINIEYLDDENDVYAYITPSYDISTISSPYTDQDTKITSADVLDWVWTDTLPPTTQSSFNLRSKYYYVVESEKNNVTISHENLIDLGTYNNKKIYLNKKLLSFEVKADFSDATKIESIDGVTISNSGTSSWMKIW
jgi:hypothetical protein